VATTFSIVAVFLPVGLMPGVSGQFFKNFGLTVVVAVLFSLLVARMITPMVAAYFLKRPARHSPWRRPMDGSLHGRAALVARYQQGGGLSRAAPAPPGAARLRDHRLWMMGIGLGALLLTGVMFVVIPTQFFPDTDSDFSQINVEMVPGTTIDQTAAKVDEVYNLIRNEPEIDVALERITEGSGRVIITLRKDRPRTSLQFERADPRLQQIADARVTFQDQNGGGGGGGSGRPISVMLSGSDPDCCNARRRRWQQMSGLKQVVAPRISADLRRPEIVIVPHLDLAASLGVTTSALSQTIRIATQGEIDMNSAKFSLSDRQVPIRVKLPLDRAAIFPRSRTCRCRPPPACRCRSPASPASRSAPVQPRSSATTRTAAFSWGPICRPAWSRARRWMPLPSCRSCRTCRPAFPTPRRARIAGRPKC
jgi:multidrug efflux pump subunit AcrB